MKQRSGMQTALLAGIAAGAAEIAWIAFYASVSDTSGRAVAREVTSTFLPSAATMPGAPLLGIVIHLILSALLGLALAKTLVRGLLPRFGAGAVMPAAVAALAAIWALNFFVILPVLNPAFVTLMPLAVTFVSKMLFGLTMAGVLRASMPGPRPA